MRFLKAPIAPGILPLNSFSERSLEDENAELRRGRKEKRKSRYV